MKRGLLLAACTVAVCPAVFAGSVVGDGKTRGPLESAGPNALRPMRPGSAIVMLPARVSLQAGDSAKVFTMLGDEVRGPGGEITLAEEDAREELARDAALAGDMPGPSPANPQGAASAFAKPAGVGSVPEPAAAMLAMLGALVLMRRRRAGIGRSA